MAFEPVLQGKSAAAFSSVAPRSSLPASIPLATDSTSAAPRPWSTIDLLGMLAGFLLTLAITVVNTRGRIFWEDEMLGWTLLRDPSWHHWVHAWNVGADGGGFSFYLLARAWFQLFGASVLGFRLFSATCFGLAFVVTWAALRRVYPTWIVAFATFNTLFFSPPLTTHFLEGRFYGLLVLATALALWLVLRLDAQPDPLPRRFYLIAFLIHGLLTTSHVLGVVYSFFLLIALILGDRQRGRRRWNLYMATAASWLLLLPELASIHAAGQVGKPHFWTKPPTVLQIFGAYTGFSPEIALVLILLAFGAAFSWRRGLGWKPDFATRRPVYLAAGCLLLVPVWFLLEGLVGTWLFSDRYLQPVTLALAYVTAELLFVSVAGLRLRAVWARQPRLSLLCAAGATSAFVLLLVFWDFHHVAQYTPEAPDFSQALTSHLPQDLPVVVDDAFTFTGLMGTEAGSGVNYIFLLDWANASSPSARWLEPTQFHLMENWKTAGYFADRIRYRDAFLKKHARFLVVDTTFADPTATPPEIGNPLARQLAATPGYQVQKVFTLDRLYKDNQRETVWLVCRGGCGADGLAAGPKLAPDPKLALDPKLAGDPEHCELTGPGQATCCQGNGCALPSPPKPPRFWQIRHWFD